MGGINPRQTAGMGSLSQQRGLHPFQKGIYQSVIVVIFYRGKKLEEVITYDLSCSLVV